MIFTGTFPDAFIPLNLRSGLKYRNLKRHAFSAPEKTWVCEHLILGTDDLDKDLVPAIRDFCSVYNMNFKDAIFWMKLYSNECSFDATESCLIDNKGITAIQKATKVGCLLTSHLKRIF